MPHTRTHIMPVTNSALSSYLDAVPYTEYLCISGEFIATQFKYLNNRESYVGWDDEDMLSFCFNCGPPCIDLHHFTDLNATFHIEHGVLLRRNSTLHKRLGKCFICEKYLFQYKPSTACATCRQFLRDSYLIYT